MKNLLFTLLFLLTKTLSSQVLFEELSGPYDESPYYKSDTTLSLYSPLKEKWLIISWQIQNREQRKMTCSTKGLGDCHKSNKLNILLSDSSLITLTSDEKERCINFSVFNFTSEQQERLEKSEAIHIEFKNGANEMKFETVLKEGQSKYFQRTLGKIKQIENREPDRFFNIMEIKNDTLKLQISYLHDDPNSMDEEHGQVTTVKFFKWKNIEIHKQYDFPSKKVIGTEENWSVWDYPRLRAIEGTIEIKSLSKDKVEAKILLKDSWGNNTTKELITFEPKSR